MVRATLLFSLVPSLLCAYVTSFSMKPQPSHTLPPPCSSEIYCYGQLLHTIQMAALYSDSKTFVDMNMKYPPKQIIQLFDQLMNKTDNNPSREILMNFVSENFEAPGSEFDEWSPSDWHESPAFLDQINDRALRKWAEDLHAIWKSLGRQMKKDVLVNSSLYSIIPVDHPVIVPGGRFREFYYWDSYWIVKGLLLSEMTHTVRGMLLNFLSIVDRFGFIPNGGRVYYLQRSQPPLLIPMVNDYLEFTNDLGFIKDNIHLLEKEFQFWMTRHIVEIKKNDKIYKLCRYNDESAGPRPESYREDVITASFIRDKDEKNLFYSHLKTAAESGWDFSSRWFVSKHDGSNKGNLTEISSKFIVPVDLNAIIYWNARLLSKFYKLLNDEKRSDKYSKIADDWLDAVTEILWSPEVGVWLDFDLLNNMKRDYFYPSNLSPLWTNCYPEEKKTEVVEHVLDYLKKTNVLGYASGIPTSLVHSGEQWDYPNAWPPLQHYVIIGLDNTGHPTAQHLAAELAFKWIRSNYFAYSKDGNMYEKYDASRMGIGGGGGEYEVQLGFGWSNGVVMDLMNKYGRVVNTDGLFNNETSSDQTPHNAASIPAFSNHFGPLFTLLLACGATITAGCIGAVVYTKRQSPCFFQNSKYTRLEPIPPNL
ncbi:hypothetical protein O3M35_012745 [Rhynocoris fuscipes]|uniref:Trehalase n=1 Tax=Rhynocoris fuscipes TaxID=488301 RepID=A0AAW1CZ53_9HEMI